MDVELIPDVDVLFTAEVGVVKVPIRVSDVKLKGRVRHIVFINIYFVIIPRSDPSDDRVH